MILRALRKASKLTVQRKAVLVNVAVDKPPNNVYFRCHRELVLDDATVLRDEEGTSRAFYFVVPQHADAPQAGATAAQGHSGADVHLAERQCPDLAGPHPHRARIPGLEIRARGLRAGAGPMGADGLVRGTQRLPDRDRRGHRP